MKSLVGDIDIDKIRILRGGYYMKIINDYDIKEIALNPAYVTNEIFKTMKMQGVKCTLDERR